MRLLAVGLAWMGERAPSFLVFGFLAAVALPGLATWMRPFLPLLVMIVLGLAVARVDLGKVATEILDPRRLALIGIVQIASTVLTALLLVGLWRIIGLPGEGTIALLVFAAAPTISSAANLCLILGYNTRLALQFTLIGTLLLPVFGPLCFAILGVEVSIPLIDVGLRIAGLVTGGFLFGWALQRVIGKTRIDRNAHVFNGIVVIGMTLFALPLLDGVPLLARENPGQFAWILLLALVLNFGGQVVAGGIARRALDQQSGSAIGLMFGNRNVSYYLAVLPPDPIVSLFVAAFQIPIYTTAWVFKERRRA